MNKNEKILAMAEKYQTFFEGWNGDIALGVRGPSFFYVIDEKTNTFDEFCTFDTAKNLETIILSFLAGELEAFLETGAKSRIKPLDFSHVSEVYGNTIPEGSIETLMLRLSVMADENARWAEKMEMIYNVLASAIGKIN